MKDLQVDQSAVASKPLETEDEWLSGEAWEDWDDEDWEEFEEWDYLQDKIDELEELRAALANGEKVD